MINSEIRSVMSGRRVSGDVIREGNTGALKPGLLLTWGFISVFTAHFPSWEMSAYLGGYNHHRIIIFKVLHQSPILRNRDLPLFYIIQKQWQNKNKGFGERFPLRKMDIN